MISAESRTAMMKLFSQKHSIIDIRLGYKLASVVIGGIRTCFLPINMEEEEYLNYYKSFPVFEILLPAISEITKT